MVTLGVRGKEVGWKEERGSDRERSRIGKVDCRRSDRVRAVGFRKNSESETRSGLVTVADGWWPIRCGGLAA